MGCGMGYGFGPEQGSYSSALAEQEQFQLEPLDAEEIIEWFELLWLTDYRLKEMITEDEWLKFIED